MSAKIICVIVVLLGTFVREQESKETLSGQEMEENILYIKDVSLKNEGRKDRSYDGEGKARRRKREAKIAEIPGSDTAATAAGGTLLLRTKGKAFLGHNHAPAQGIKDLSLPEAWLIDR